MIPVLVTLSVLLLAALAEWLHFRRIRRVERLAFASGATPRAARLAAFARILGAAAFAWGLTTLFFTEAKSQQRSEIPAEGHRHIILVLDVSPSMRLKDSGPNGDLMRIARAKEVVLSIFERIALDQAKVSVVAFYTSAKPVVIDTMDLNVVRNILDDLPLRWTFETGKTNLMAGLREAAALAKPWHPGSTTVFLVSDGDTVPDSGMPVMPKSIAKTIVIGVGNPTQGKYIDGHQSRQDTNSLRQIATRLGGTYFDGNVKNLPSSEIRSLAEALPMKDSQGYGLREAALTAIGIGAVFLAGTPVLLGLRKW